MLHLPGKKIIGLSLLLSLVLGGRLMAQQGRTTLSFTPNLPYYDDKKMHFGFTIGINGPRLRPVLSNSFFGDTLQSVRGKMTPGFTLGFVTNFRLHDYYDLRLLPCVSFYQRDVHYTFYSGTKKIQSLESTFIELPLLLKFKSDRRKNSRMYLLAGLKGGIEVGAKKKERKRTELRTNSRDLSVEYGIGFDIYYPYFKFSPEIRFSHGLVNLLNPDPNLYSQSLLRLTTHTVSIYFHFQ